MHHGGDMKEIVKDVAVISLPHRDWSCEAISYRVKVMPMPGEPGGGNHLFIMIEDRFEFINHDKSRDVLSRIILSRYMSIPARRIHFIFYVSAIGTPNGLNVKMYNFDRDENRQAIMKKDSVDYSGNTAVCAMVMF
ncbi:hypothetical protein ECTOK1_P11650 (plasmid) [Escherichia coli]|nr:hypothetical protein ECTOK1_P11650 [Escherichia coli]